MDHSNKYYKKNKRNRRNLILSFFLVLLLIPMKIEAIANAHCFPPESSGGSTNQAPILNPLSSLTLSTLPINSLDPTGESVGHIIQDGSITDPDISPAPEAIAIISVDNAHGQWQFQTSDGAGWHLLETTINDCNATLLDSVALVRFVPEQNWYGSSVFMFRAWDQTFGISGLANINTTGNGGSFPYSSEKAIVQIKIGSVIDTEIPQPPSNLIFN